MQGTQNFIVLTILVELGLATIISS